jgi:hypothetical protein
MGSKDRGNKETRKPKTAKKKEKNAPVIPSRVRPVDTARPDEKESES